MMSKCFSPSCIALCLLLTATGSQSVLAAKSQEEKKFALTPASSIVPANNTYVVRVPGSSFVSENPGALVMGGARYRGWGASFVAPENTSTWFHVPIPVQSVGEGTTTRLKKVYVLFRSDKTVITDIHLWDGGRQIKQYSKMRLSGDYGAKITNANMITLAVPEQIGSGIGVSIGVTFNADGVVNGRNAGEIVFVGAGAVYEN